MKKNNIQLIITPIYTTKSMTNGYYTPHVTDNDWLYQQLAIEARNCIATLENNVLTLTYKPSMGCIAGMVAYQYVIGCDAQVQLPREEHMTQATHIINRTYITKMLALVQGLNTGRWA